MKKISVIGATLLGAAVLCAAPISLHLSQEAKVCLPRIRYGHAGYYGPSQAAAPPGTPCREAAKLQFPTDGKTRRAYRRECRQAWKAQKASAQ